MQKKQECMAAMQGLMVTGLVGEENTICLDEALKAEAQKEKFKAALPKMLGKSTKSLTIHAFNLCLCSGLVLFRY